MRAVRQLTPHTVSKVNKKGRRSCYLADSGSGLQKLIVPGFPDTGVDRLWTDNNVFWTNNNKLTALKPNVIIGTRGLSFGVHLSASPGRHFSLVGARAHLPSAAGLN